MADAVLRFLAQFSKRLFKSVRNEQRIVAEAAAASRREIDPPFARSLETMNVHLSPE